MSSGACRALVAVLITLVAALALASPLAAESERLREQSTVIYRVDPSAGTIDVDIVVKLTNNERSGLQPGHLGTARHRGARRAPRLPGLLGRPIERPARPLARRRRQHPGHRGRWGGREPPVAYTLDAAIDQSASQTEQTPARVGEAYVYFCLVGQDTDIGLVRVEIVGQGPLQADPVGHGHGADRQGSPEHALHEPRRALHLRRGHR